MKIFFNKLCLEIATVAEANEEPILKEEIEKKSSTSEQNKSTCKMLYCQLFAKL